VEEEYRVPLIKEFVQGFKFQIKITHSFGFVMLGGDKTKDTHTTRETWEDVEVWWKHPENEKITEVTEDDQTITVSGAFVNFFAPYSDKQIKQLLSENKIRVKI